jgi:hypothetical protein
MLDTAGSAQRLSTQFPHFAERTISGSVGAKPIQGIVSGTENLAVLYFGHVDLEGQVSGSSSKMQNLVYLSAFFGIHVERTLSRVRSQTVNA